MRLRSLFKNAFDAFAITAMMMFVVSCGGGSDGESKGSGDDCVGCYFEPSLVAVDWTWINPSPQGDVLYDNVWDGTQIVAVGANGRIMTSSDGLSWTMRDSGADDTLRSVAWSGTRLVAGGYSGTIVTSDDGQTWVKRKTPASSSSSLSIIWDGAQFISVGRYRTIMKSADGVSWVLMSSSNSGSFYNELVGVAYSGTLYVAVSKGGAVLTSNDSSNWTEVNAGIADTLTTIVWNGSVFVAGSTSNKVYVSGDGVSWVSHSVDATYTSTYITDMYVSGGDIYAVAQGALDNDVFVSGNGGVSWTAYQSGAASGLYGITKTDANWNVVGNAGVIANASNVSSWASASSGVTKRLSAIAKNGDGSIIVAAGSGATLYSTDGVTWNEVLHPFMYFYGIAYGNGIFAVVGSSGVIKTSPDGMNWTSVNSTTFNQLNSIVWDGTQFIAVGESGTIVSSPDGTNWTEQSSGTAEELDHITWSGSEYVAVGSSGVILRSTNSTSWKQVNSGTSQDLTGVVWTGSTYVVVGAGYLKTTKDFATWLSPLGEGGELFKDVAVVGSKIVVVGSDGTIFGSDDSIDWYRWGTPTENVLYGSIELNSTIMAVGQNGTVLQSENMSGF